MVIFMLSLGGIPPLAGFFGKFYVFSAALGAGANHGLLWLVVIALFGSFISLYYYLIVLKAIFVDASSLGRTGHVSGGSSDLVRKTTTVPPPAGGFFFCPLTPGPSPPVYSA